MKELTWTVIIGAASFLSGALSMGIMLENKHVIHISGCNQEIRVQGPVSNVVFDKGSYGNMVISDRGEVKQ